MKGLCANVVPQPTAAFHDPLFRGLAWWSALADDLE
jgi:hypothetical protein